MHATHHLEELTVVLRLVQPVRTVGFAERVLHDDVARVCAEWEIEVHSRLGHAILADPIEQLLKIALKDGLKLSDAFLREKAIDATPAYPVHIVRDTGNRRLGAAAKEAEKAVVLIAAFGSSGVQCWYEVGVIGMQLSWADADNGALKLR